MDIFKAYYEARKSANTPEALFFAGAAFGALSARVSQEEIVKMITEALTKKEYQA